MQTGRVVFDPHVVVVERDLPEGKPWWLIEREPDDWVAVISAGALRDDPGAVMDSYGRGLRAVRVPLVPGQRGVVASGMGVAAQVVTAIVGALP